MYVPTGLCVPTGTYVLTGLYTPTGIYTPSCFRDQVLLWPPQTSRYFLNNVDAENARADGLPLGALASTAITI